MYKIGFQPVDAAERAAFAAECAESLSVALRESFPENCSVPVSDIFESMDSFGSEVFHILSDGVRVGGVVVVINSCTNRNSLELLFLNSEACGKGIGSAVWQAIEKKYPNTRVWETITPYFERRNIHFYVNKCGFKIVEFFNSHHKDTRHSDPDIPGRDNYFRFEKEMNPFSKSF